MCFLKLSTKQIWNQNKNFGLQLDFLHKKENAEKPKCEAMKNMDHSKMDMNDPITQAMMKQCMASDHHGDNAPEEVAEHHETKTEKHEDNGHHGDMKKSQ